MSRYKKKKEPDYISSILNDILNETSSSSDEENVRKLEKTSKDKLKSNLNQISLKDDLPSSHGKASSRKLKVKGNQPDSIKTKKHVLPESSAQKNYFKNVSDHNLAKGNISQRSSVTVKVPENKSTNETGSVKKNVVDNSSTLDCIDSKGSKTYKNRNDYVEDSSLYTCSEISLEVLPKDIWYDRIRHYIDIISESDEVLAAIIAIKSLNASTASDECLDVLETYLRNLMLHPTEDTFRQIKFENKILQDKVINVEGGGRFLTALGFSVLESENDKQHYFVYPYQINEAELLGVIDLMHRAEGFKLSPHSKPAIEKARSQCHDIENTEFPFRLKNNKQRKPKRVPSSKFTQIKIRLPDGKQLQGTFSVDDKLTSVKSFIEEKTGISKEYTLFNPPAEPFKTADYEKTLEQLELFPAVLLNLKWEVAKLQKEKQDKLNGVPGSIKKPIKPKS